MTDDFLQREAFELEVVELEPSDSNRWFGGVCSCGFRTRPVSSPARGALDRASISICWLRLGAHVGAEHPHHPVQMLGIWASGHAPYPLLGAARAEFLKAMQS